MGVVYTTIESKSSLNGHVGTVERNCQGAPRVLQLRSGGYRHSDEKHQHLASLNLSEPPL